MLTNTSRTRTRTGPAISPTGNYEIGKTYFPLVPGVHDGKWGPGFSLVHNFETNFEWAEVCVDELHAGPPYLTGGPFQHRLYAQLHPSRTGLGHITCIQLDFEKKYVGGFAPRRWAFHPSLVSDEFDFEGRSFTNLLAENSVDRPSMGDWGDKAWSSTKPKLEKAGAYVFLREAKDIPRMLKTTAKGFHDIWNQSLGSKSRSYSGKSWIMQPKKVADHYINHQFGWAPFLGDIAKFDSVYQNSAKILKKLSEKNGQWSRRRVTLKSETTSTILGTGNGTFVNPPFDGGLWSTERSTVTVSEKKTTEIIAVGSFKYYRPEFDLGSTDYSSAWNTAMRHMTIYGLRVSPINVYRAIPWSWAVDWVSKVGDHIDHLNDIVVDSVASKYCFVMQRVKRSRILHQKIPLSCGTVNLHLERIIESKERSEATSPYGFGLSWANLTPRQLTIAAALGISRNAKLAK